MRKVLKFLPLLAVLAVALCLVGCGGGATLGTKGSDTASVEVTNGLGVTVANMRLQAEGGTAWSSELFEAGESLEANAAATLYYPATYATGEVTLEVTAEDGTVLTFDGLSLGDYSAMTLASGSGVNYVDFTATDKSTGSTKEAALAAKEAAEAAEKEKEEEEAAAAAKAAEEAAAAAAAEEAAKAAEEEAAKQAAAAAAANTASSSSGSSSSSSSSSSSTSGNSGSSSSSSQGTAAAEVEAPTQSEDQCVTDPIFRN